MNHFVKEVEESSTVYRFLFSKIHTSDGPYFHVSVRDQENIPHLFTIRRNGLLWGIIDAPKVPHWILEKEAQLVEAILEKGLN